MPTKTFDASRHVDLLDLSRATDVIGKADASNAFQFLHLLVADDMRSLHRVVAQETVHDKDGNVRDNPARRSIFNDGNANTGYNNVQDVLDYLISKDTASIHTVGNTRTLEALGSPGSTTQQKLDSLYSSTISPKDGDLVFVGLDMLTDTNKDAGIWHRFNNAWEHLVPAERYIDQRIKNNQAEIMQLEKAVTATLTYTPRELGNTRIIRIDLNTVDGFGKNYLLTDATPYEGIDVYLNGVRLIPENRRGDGDYLVEYATNTIRFQEQLPLQYVLQVDILIPPERVNPAYVRIHEIDLTEKGTNPFNGVTTDFNLFSNLTSKIATPKSLTRNEELMIYKGLGDRMKPGIDYTVDAAGLVKFTVAPAATDGIWALWYESRPRPVGGGGGGGGVTLPLDQSYAQYFGFDPVNGIPDWVDDRNHLQVVQTLAELSDRGLLPASHLQEGKLVFVKDDNRLYEFLPATAGARTDSMTDWRAINAAGPKVYNRVADLPQPGGTTAVHDGDFAIVRYHNDGRTRLNTVFMARKYGTATLPRPSTTAAIKEDGTVLNITGLTPGSPNNYTMYVEVDPTISLAPGTAPPPPVRPAGGTSTGWVSADPEPPMSPHQFGFWLDLTAATGYTGTFPLTTPAKAIDLVMGDGSTEHLQIPAMTFNSLQDQPAMVVPGDPMQGFQPADSFGWWFADQPGRLPVGFSGVQPFETTDGKLLLRVDVYEKSPMPGVMIDPADPDPTNPTMFIDDPDPAHSTPVTLPPGGFVAFSPVADDATLQAAPVAGGGAGGWPVTVVGRHKIYVQYSDGLVDEVEVLPGTYVDWNDFKTNGLVLGAISPNPIAYHALDLGSDGHTYLSFENSAAGATFIHRVFKPVNTSTNPKPPVLPNRMIWIPTSTETYSNALKTDPDFTDAYPHDLQVTMENGHKVIKIWDNPNSQWVTVYDEDTVKQWIAAGNLFTGTAEETGHGTAGAIDVGNMPAETALGPTDKGHYWVWVGTSGHAIAASEIGGVASAIDGQALSVGDWIQVSSPAAGKYQYSVIPGDLLSKATAQSLFGMNNWVKGAHQQGTVIVHQGDVYKATVAVLATDPAPNDPANTKWTKIPISGGVRSVASDGQLPPSAPAGSMYLVINSAQASSKPALYIYDLPTGQWQQVGGGGASQALDITGGTRINNIGVPIGTVITFASTNIPKGWLRADGNTFDGRLYPQLQSMLGINRTPDLRGQFIRGATGATLDNFVQHQWTTGLARARFITDYDAGHSHAYTDPLRGWGAHKSSDSYDGGETKRFHTARDGATATAGRHGHIVNGGGDPETAPDHVILFMLIKADDIGMFGGA